MSCLPLHDRDAIRSQFQTEGVVCIRDAFAGHRDMAKEAQHTRVFDDVRVPSRKSQCLPEHHAIAQGVYADPAVNAVFEDLHGYPLQRSPHFPVEYRTYPAQSAGMQRHSALPMFDPPQTELVYTVRNDDAQTRFRWWDASGKRHEVSPRPNDLVMVRASGPLHDVTPLGDGTRSIVKFVAHAPDAAPRTGVLETQRKHCPASE
ncbi:MAG: hypothetical protein CL450_07640 [Acidimicrobiaceae bacterium]|nr:hypothetical protein [Acidimicrobiaceae bacterium]